jgi:hypothetical protein
MKKIALLLFAVCLAFAAHAQRNWGVGLRFGEPSGVTAKKYFSESSGLELSVGTGGYIYRPSRGNGRYQQGGLAVMVNYHIMHDIGEVDGLQWYFGFGGTMKVREYYYDGSGDIETRLGLAVNGVAGLEYTLEDLPISFFLDIIPNLEMFPTFFAPGFDSGIGARYNF